MLRWIVAGIVALAAISPPALSAQEEQSAWVVTGTCAEAIDYLGTDVARLKTPAASGNAAIGSAGAVSLSTGTTEIAVRLADLTATPHAITLEGDSGVTVCGEIGGAPDAAGAFANALLDGTGATTMIAYLQPIGDDPDGTRITLFTGPIASSSAAVPSGSGPRASESGDAESPRSATITLGAGSSREQPLPVGASADIGDGWIVSVIDVNPDATELVLAENMFNDRPERRHQFFMITISATYEGSDESASLYASGSFRLVGDSAVAYDYGASCGVIPNDFPSTEVFQGGTITGNICFSVRSRDVDSLVMYSEELFSFDDDNRVWFALR